MEKKAKNDNKEELKQEVEETAEEEALEVSVEEIEENLEEKLEKLEQEKAELHDKWLRQVAEFENFRRRSALEKANWIKNANERLILELCEVKDNFERALAASKTTDNRKNFEKGIKLIYKQIENILNREGVEKIETDGKEFDPEFHEALAHIPSELEENKISATIQNGYKMNGKVIRAARVAVSNGEKPAKPETDKKKKKKKK